MYHHDGNQRTLCTLHRLKWLILNTTLSFCVDFKDLCISNPLCKRILQQFYCMFSPVASFINCKWKHCNKVTQEFTFTVVSTCYLYLLDIDNLKMTFHTKLNVLCQQIMKTTQEILKSVTPKTVCHSVETANKTGSSCSKEIKAVAEKNI